jgi:hypothetical protein
MADDHIHTTVVLTSDMLIVWLATTTVHTSLRRQRISRSLCSGICLTLGFVLLWSWSSAILITTLFIGLDRRINISAPFIKSITAWNVVCFKMPQVTLFGPEICRNVLHCRAMKLQVLQIFKNGFVCGFTVSNNATTSGIRHTTSEQEPIARGVPIDRRRRIGAPFELGRVNALT